MTPKFRNQLMQEEIENCHYSASYNNEMLRVNVINFENGHGEDIRQSYYQIFIDGKLIKYEFDSIESLQDAADKAESYLNTLANLLKNLGFKK